MKSILTLPNIFLQIIFGIILFTQNLMAQGGLQVDFGSDTLFVCADEILTLTPTVSGGTAPYLYSWSDASNQPDNRYIPQHGDSVWLWVEVRDALNQTTRDSVYMIAFANCIWPGDMNGDGIANHVDLLEWGRAVGSIGPKRPGAHTNWMGQASPTWGSALPGGHDFAYADTDGDGEVHMNDLQAIDKNYTQVLPQGGNSNSNGPVLQFAFPPDSVLTVGNTVRIPVFLGTAGLPADSIYGVAVSILYDNSIIDQGSITVDFGSSWLGDPQTDLVGMDHDFHQAGQLDIALTRITQRARSGHGRLFDIIVTIDNVAGKNNSVFTLNIDALDAQLIQANGLVVPLTSRSLTLDILPEPFPRGPEPSRLHVEVFPNPTASLLIVDPGQYMLREVQLINMLGQQFYKEERDIESAFTWNLADLDRGTYFLRMKTAEGGWITKKIQLID